MNKTYCPYASEHRYLKGDICTDCWLLVDTYGNTEEDFLHCSFPDCGCDGARLCMARNGASAAGRQYNVEGMYDSPDPTARMAFIGFIYKGPTESSNEQDD